MEIEFFLLLRFLMIIVCVIGFITQIGIPAFYGKPLFPMFRRRATGEVLTTFDEYRKQELQNDLKRVETEKDLLNLEAKVNQAHEELEKEKQRVRSKNGIV